MIVPSFCLTGASGIFSEVIDMNLVLIGNIISLFGCGVMVAIGLLKKRSHILAAQCLQFTLQGVAHLILGATSGVVACITGIIRNLVFAKIAVTAAWKLFFIALQAVLSLPAMTLNPVTWLPLLSCSLFTWFLDLKNEVQLKIMMIAAQAMWVVYDFAYRNYVALAFDLFTMVSTCIGIAMILKDRK